MFDKKIPAKRMLATVLAAVVLPMSVSAAPNSTLDPQGSLSELARFANAEEVLKSPLSTTGGPAIACGEGCGACSANCQPGEDGSCSCSPEGECGTWPAKKATYSCTCDCSTPPDPLPESICIGGVCASTGPVR